MWNTMTAACVVKGPFAFCSGTVNDIGVYKANPGQEKAKRERKIMLCLAGEQVQYVNPV